MHIKEVYIYKTPGEHHLNQTVYEVTYTALLQHLSADIWPTKLYTVTYASKDYSNI